MKYNGTMVLSFLLIAAATLCAQPRHGDRSQWPDRIESYKKVRMLEALKLGEDESVKFVSRYDKHLEIMHGFDKERNDLIDNLDTLSRSNASDGEFDEIYGNLLEIDKKIAGERQKFLSELKAESPESCAAIMCSTALSSGSSRRLRSAPALTSG